MSIRILTQNCYWSRVHNKKKRFEYIRKEIESSDPDVVCLQEVVFPFDSKYVRSIDEYSLIRRRGVWSNKGGLLSLVRNDNVQEQIWQKYKNQGAIISWQIAERFMGKGFLAFRLARNDVWIINTHLCANHGLIEREMKVQQKQVDELLDFVRDKEEVVIAGDLNITPNTPAYRTLMSEFVDCSTGEHCTFPRKAQTLDYILYKGTRYNIKAHSIVKYLDASCRVSDHFGVMVELTNRVTEDSINAVKISEKTGKSI